MNTATFKGYGVNAGDRVVVLDRILYCYPIDYNGLQGTCIVFDNGKELCVEEWPSSVNMVMQQAKAQP